MPPEETEIQIESPISRLAQSAIAIRELYLSYRAAGFTENEALKLVALIIQGSSSDGDDAK